jgi:hypothetical protein
VILNQEKVELPTLVGVDLGLQYGFVALAFERDNAQGPVLSVKFIDGRHSVRQAVVDLGNTGKNQVN